MIVNIGETEYPSIVKSPSTALWASESDFLYTYHAGSEACVSFADQTGVATGNHIGISTYKATHKVTNRIYYFTVYVDRYTYVLHTFFHFSSEATLLIRDLYNRVDRAYVLLNAKTRAWYAARVLSEFVYDDITMHFGFLPINDWDDVAGSVTTPGNRKMFFTNILKYTESEYDILNSVLNAQHSNPLTSDFTHMQYALAARLAYELQLDGKLSNVYVMSPDNEFVSYLGGWLGDATLIKNGTATVFGNDDYMADLDAENLFRAINGGDDSITAINDYYRTISIGNQTRATIFKSYISYSNAESMVLSELEKSLSEVRTLYPDTYDFLRSLQDGLAEIADY